VLVISIVKMEIQIFTCFVSWKFKYFPRGWWKIWYLTPKVVTT